MTAAPWIPYNHGAGKRIWFLARNVDTSQREDYLSKSGNLVRYASMKTAQRAADRLNREVTILTSCPPLLDHPYTGRYLRDRPDGGFVLEVEGREVTFGPEYRDQLGKT